MDLLREAHTFLEPDVADALYSGRIGGYPEYHPIENVPSSLRRCILFRNPDVKYVRVGPTFGDGKTMEWWLGAWSCKHPDAILFDTRIWTIWRQI